MPKSLKRNHGRADALCWFGATGDLGYKMTIPGLYAMARHGHLDVPVIGIARGGQTLDGLKERMRASIAEHGGVHDPVALDLLMNSLQYVDGDYTDPSTFEALKHALDNVGSRAPAHYLAIPPSLFGPVVQSLGESGAADNARLIVEKPFGRDLASAQALNQIVHSVFPEYGRVSHRPLPREGGGAEPAVLPLRQLVPRAHLEPQLHRERADHDGRRLRGGRARQVLRRSRGAARRRPEPPVPDGGAARDGAPARHG